jgi:hypothetical protein
MSTTEHTDESSTVPEKLQEIKADRSKALRTPKELPDGNPEGVEDARTAARYIGERDGNPMFEVVTTRLVNFPVGADKTEKHSQLRVAKWVRDNDPEVIDATEEWPEIALDSGDEYPRPAVKREAAVQSDGDFKSLLVFDLERQHSVTVETDSSKRRWQVRDARFDNHFESIGDNEKAVRMAEGGRYVNLEDVPDDVRVKETRTGICPSCKEDSTAEAERELTVFVSPDGTDGWADCDRDCGHRHAISEVLLRVE